MLADKVKQRRKELGLTQEELAHKMGYKSQSTIAHIEDGTNDVTLPKVELLAKALQTTPGFLMGWEQEEEECQYIEKITGMIKRLDAEDRGRIEERFSILLEQDKYK